jgi:hypothetical protein
MNAEDRLDHELEKFRKQFKYRYVGGGFFRDQTVPKGISADLQHGDEIITRFCDDFAEFLSKTTPKQ